MPETLMTRDEVVAALLATIDAHPNAVNPRTSGSPGAPCVYTDRRDRSSHCLVGQVAADLGWKVPGPYAESAPGVQAVRLGWPITQSAAGALSVAQSKADNATFDGRPWSTIRDDVAALAEVAG